MFTRHREEFRFHLAPLRNHFQIVPVKVTVSHIFGPVHANASAICHVLNHIGNNK